MNWFTRFSIKAAQKYLDYHVRAPRGLGMSVDDGLPDRGWRYGGAQTIHNTGTIDIQLNEDDKIVAVWFRCQMLPFRVSYAGSGDTLYVSGQDNLPSVIAVELTS